VTAFGPLRTFGSRLLRTYGADPSGCLLCPWAASAGWPPPLMSPDLGCAQVSSFTSLRGPPDCRSPAACLRATVARKHGGYKGGLGLDAARTRGRARTKNSPEDCSSPGEGNSACKRCCAEKRRARGLARSASCELTHRGCLSAKSEANEASSAVGPRDRCTEPGHKQSCGLFVPGEGPGLWPEPQGSRRAATTAEHKRRSQAKHAFAWGPSKQASEKHRTDRRTNASSGPIVEAHPPANLWPSVSLQGRLDGRMNDCKGPRAAT